MEIRELNETTDAEAVDLMISTRYPEMDRHTFSGGGQKYKRLVGNGQSRNFYVAVSDDKVVGVIVVQTGITLKPTLAVVLFATAPNVKNSDAILIAFLRAIQGTCTSEIEFHTENMRTTEKKALELVGGKSVSHIRISPHNSP